MKCRIGKIILAFVLILSLGTGYTAAAVHTCSGETQEAKTSSFVTSGRIWIAGDSIAADHSYEDEASYVRFVHGWGEMLGDYLTADAQVYNKAISGQTAKFFTQESNYTDIMNGIGKGDFLLIQFGHNDYKSAGSDHSSLPTDVEGSYKWYLKNYYIDPALDAGAMPVLCTSVVLCSFDSGTVSEYQAQSKFVDAMKELYQEYRSQGIEIGLIDTYAVTQALLNAQSSGASDYYALKYDRRTGENGSRTTSLDHVHYSELGARTAADIIAQNLFVKYADFNRFNKRGLVDGGEGTQENPYLIGTWAQLYQVLQDDERNKPENYYKLTQDLLPVMSHVEWETVFRADLDGNGHILLNPVNKSQERVFDKNYGTIRNVCLDFNLRHEAETVQTLFVKDNYGIIEDCSAKGSVHVSYCGFHKEPDEWKCGVFAAQNEDGGTVRGCLNRTDVTVETDMVTAMLGGIAGYNAGVIENCENRGSLELGTSEYVPKDAPVHNEVISCSGGITAVTADRNRLLSNKGGTAAKVHSALKYVAGVISGDAVVPVDEAELRRMLDEQKPDVTPEPVPSDKPVSSDIPDMIMGDINGDGAVSLEDAQLALRCALKITDTDERSIKTGDLDGNGKIELGEAQRILRAALRIEALS